MGDLHKKNWKRLMGVRGEDPLADLEIVRLKDIIAGAAATGVVTMGGDVGGSSDAATVSGLQGVPVSASAPASGQTLVFSGGVWAPATPAAGGGGLSIGEEFRVDIPAGASLAAKIAGATLPAGWSIVLGNDGSVDAEITAAATDIALIHTESAFVGDIRLHEFDAGGAPLGGYYVINDTAVGLLSKSNTLGTQFTVLGFTGLITLTRRQVIYVKLLPTP
jgi:hypothetical protein